MSSNLGLPFMYANSRHGEASRDVALNEANTAGLKAAQPSGCGNEWAVAASIPGMIPMGNFGNSPEGGCAIDLQSQLLFGDPATARFKGPKQLFERPFATTPNLGLGSIDHIDEQSHVMFGHSTANRKSIQTVTDKQFPVFEPLLAERESDIPDNNYFVEPFLRGGYSARLAPRTRVDLTK
jgi:hypothetical protein